MTGVAEIEVTVKVFASLREAVGVDSLTIRVPDATPVGALWAHLPAPACDIPAPRGLRYALNDLWTLPGAPLRDGDQVSLVLPVSGG